MFPASSNGWFLFFVLSAVLAAGAYAQDLDATYHPDLRQNVFVKEEYHFLNVSGIGMFIVYDTFDCALECLSNPSCLSLNLAASKGADGKFWCELLTSDKYINPCEYKENKTSHHFFLKVAHHMTSCKHGGNWLAFWWWTADATWPVGESDVLAYPYGYCSSYSQYCFGRIPSWAREDSTEMLAIDSEGNEYKWKFDSDNVVAHAAWLAFHDHVTTLAGTVKNVEDSWKPEVLNGTQPKAKQDSFMYREQNGVKSILLDDDNCDCLSTLNIGHGMCNAGHSTSYGPANQFGVDALYDSNCNVPRPEIGLTLFFRVK